MTAEQYNNLPDFVVAILDSFDENQDHYAECERIEKLLKLFGYGCEWGLSGDIDEVFPLEKETAK